MKGKITLVLLASALTAFGAWDSVRKSKSNTTQGNVVVWDKNESVTDVDVSVSELTNAVDVVLVNSNAWTAASVAALDTLNGPNDLLKLDENGKIDAEFVTTITVIFTGNHTSTNSP